MIIVKVLLLAVVAILAVDAAVLATLAWKAGPWFLLTFGFATGLLGLLVILCALWRLQHTMEVRLRDVDEMAEARDPKERQEQSSNDRFWGDVILLLAGVLMLLPGPITDLLGIAFLIPAIRRRVAKMVTSRFS